MAEQEADVASIACSSSVQGNSGEDFQKYLGRFCKLCGHIATKMTYNSIDVLAVSISMKNNKK